MTSVTRVLAMFQRSAEHGDRLLWQVGAEVWEGHIVDVVNGVVTAVARRVGSGQEFDERSWPLEAIVDVADAGLEYHELEEDPLQAQARRLREEASAVGDLTLAEQLAQEFLRRPPR